MRRLVHHQRCQRAGGAARKRWPAHGECGPFRRVKREYILAYDVSYEVRLGNGKVLVPAESLIANRALLFDENQVLGFEAAQEALANSMAEIWPGRSFAACRRSS